MPAQAGRHDLARGGHRQPRETEQLVAYGAPEMSVTISARRPFDRATR
jgi:hypothetical protein